MKRLRPYRPKIRRDPTSLVCPTHAMAFVPFRTGSGYGYRHSHGCPVCVGQARERVEAEKRNNKYRGDRP